MASCIGTPSPEEIVGCLQRPGAPDQPRTRGLPRPGAGAAPAAPTSAAPGAVNLRINFQFNSARLTPEDRATLDNLGRALTDPSLRNSRFEIAGHTDALGSEAFNRRLSEERARTVREYLASRFRIPPEVLVAVGLGKSRLYDPEHPAAAVNRRVEITNIGQ